MYDIVEENEYSELVKQRQDDDWIVDDGNLFYFFMSLIFSTMLSCPVIVTHYLVLFYLECVLSYTFRCNSKLLLQYFVIDFLYCNILVL